MSASRGTTPLIALKPRPAPEDSQPKPKQLRPLQPQSSVDLTPVPTSDVPELLTRRSQAERDLHFLRQQFEHDTTRWKQLHTICLKANRALERNISDLRKQVEDMRSAAIAAAIAATAVNFQVGQR